MDLNSVSSKTNYMGLKGGIGSTYGPEIMYVNTKQILRSLN